MKIALISFQLAGLIAVCAVGSLCHFSGAGRFTASFSNPSQSQSCTTANAVSIESLTDSGSGTDPAVASADASIREAGQNNALNIIKKLRVRRVLVAKRADLVCKSSISQGKVSRNPVAHRNVCV